jgi:hypothetical protein
MSQTLVEDLRKLVDSGINYVELSRAELRELLAMIDANEAQTLEQQRLTQGF